MMSTPTGILATPASRSSAAISLGVPLHQPEGRVDGAAQAEQAGLAVLRLQPRRIEPVVHGGRAEVPQDRIGAAPRQQRPAADLVALPLADLGGGEVADVVDVHHQQRAEVGLLQRLPGPRQPVAVQAAIVDPLLEIDAHGAERRQRARPVVARVDVLGADRRLGSGADFAMSSSRSSRASWRSVVPAAASCKRHRAALDLRARVVDAGSSIEGVALGPGYSLTRIPG